MSPSKIPIRTEVPSLSKVFRSSVVLPAPGEDIRFTAQTPDASSRRSFSSATRSFSDSRFSRIVTLVCPVSTYPE